MGSAFAATSPTALNQSSQCTTFSASSLNVVVRPANVNVHLFALQSCSFSFAAANARSNASLTSLVVGRMNGCSVVRSLSDRRCRAPLRISWLLDLLEVPSCGAKVIGLILGG